MTWLWVLAVCGVLWVLFVARYHPFKRGQHAASRALPVTRVDLPAVGSMSLADERTLRLSAPPWLTAPLQDSEGILTAPQDVEPWPAEMGARVGRGLAATAATAPARPLGPYGGQLGPRARLVLDRYDARCRERWGFSL